jgi:ATP synthase protein I
MAVLLQVGSVTILALGAAVIADWSSAWFVALGGSAAIVPNGLFAMRLALHRGRSPESYPVVFFLGQFAKIGLTVGLLGAISKWAGPVQWLPLLLGLIVALKAPLFALLYVRPEAVSPEVRPEAGRPEAAGLKAVRPKAMPADGRLPGSKGGVQVRPEERREAPAQLAEEQSSRQQR